jgi:[citrate (pro-3S)-lyase] ligase
MSDYNISTIYKSDIRSNKQLDELLKTEGIRRDANLEYTCGIFDESMNLIASGSYFGNTLRCLAVSSSHQGEGLMNKVITHLIQMQYEKGNTHLFLYTKFNSSKFFEDLGFYEITCIDKELVFMENRRTGFSDYLKALIPSKRNGAKVAALVMNANPFSLGHLYLVEKAARENDILHLFILSEDASLVPFSARKKLVIEGTSHLKNIVYHDSGPYIISNATFPSYFQKDDESVITGHAMLDITIFGKIAEALGINYRYVGEEPNSQVTNIYNGIMKSKLPEFGITCIEVPRKKYGSNVISASTIRQAIKDGNFELLKDLVPDTTLNYFLSDEAIPVIEKIREAENVIHY